MKGRSFRHRGRHQPFRRRAAALAGTVAIAVLLGACSRSSAAPGSTSTALSSTTSSSSTTTTTTLPAPVGVPGSHPGGADAFLGRALRVPVVAVPDGATTAPLPAPGTASYVGIDRIAFRHFGSGPELLLITGEDASMSSWPATLLTALAQHYRVTIFDLPGTGYSGPLPPQLSLERWADDTAGLIEALHLTRPTVLGWGLGGEVALGLAERHPGSAGSLVLVDTSAGGRDATPPSQADERVISSPLVTATELARVFFSSHPAAAGAAWLQGLETAVPDDLTQPAVVAEAQLQRAVWRSGELSAALGTIHLPVLVVSGSNDPLFPAPDGSLLESSIAGAKSIVYQGADYASIMEQTTRFVSALEAFTG